MQLTESVNERKIAWTNFKDYCLSEFLFMSWHNQITINNYVIMF